MCHLFFRNMRNVVTWHILITNFFAVITYLNIPVPINPVTKKKTAVLHSAFPLLPSLHAENTDREGLLYAEPARAVKVQLLIE